MHEPEAQEYILLKEIISWLSSGCCGELETVSIEEEYNAIFLGIDDFQSVRDVLVLESLAQCLENGSESNRQWLLKNAVEVCFPTACVFAR